MTLTKGHARNAAKTPLDQRLADMALVVSDADGSPRVGVLGGANASIVTGTGTMNVSVDAAEFVTSKGKSDGVMIFTNNGTVTVPVSAAPTSNSRYTIVWVRHGDDTTGDANSLPVFGTTDGAAAASPIIPTAPSGALRLATLRIYAGTSSTNASPNTVSNDYAMTAARGGVVPFRSATGMATWEPADGALAYLIDTKETWQRVNGAWVAVLRPKAGWTALPLTDGWTNFGSGYAPLRARLDVAGNVHIQGQILPRSGYPSAEVFATLPVGMRPSARIAVPVLNNFSATAAIAGVLIDTNGNMNVAQAGVGTFSFGNTVLSVE